MLLCSGFVPEFQPSPYSFLAGAVVVGNGLGESPAWGHSSDIAHDPTLGFPILKIRGFLLLNN